MRSEISLRSSSLTVIFTQRRKEISFLTSLFSFCLLLPRSLHRNISVLSKPKSEEGTEVRAASPDEEVPVRRPPHCDVGLAVFVVITNNRLVSRSTEYSYKYLAIAAPIDPP